jgi:EF-hand domain pair
MRPEPLNHLLLPTGEPNMNKLTSLLIASALAFSLPALADIDGKGTYCKRPGNQFTNADTNKDGSLDKAEAQAMHDKHFDEMDTNHDGKLSKEEMAACRQGGMGGAMHNKGSKGFQKADKNNDGTLDKEEAKSLPNVSMHFDEIDTDKDGTVDRNEVHNYMKNTKATESAK